MADMKTIAQALQPVCCVDKKKTGPIWCTAKGKDGEERIFCLEHGVQVNDEILFGAKFEEVQT